MIHIDASCMDFNLSLLQQRTLTAQWKVGTSNIYFWVNPSLCQQPGQRAHDGAEVEADEGIGLGHAPLSSKPAVFMEVKFPYGFTLHNPTNFSSHVLSSCTSKLNTEPRYQFDSLSHTESLNLSSVPHQTVRQGGAAQVLMLTAP